MALHHVYVEHDDAIVFEFPDGNQFVKRIVREGTIGDLVDPPAPINGSISMKEPLDRFGKHK